MLYLLLKLNKILRLENKQMYSLTSKKNYIRLKFMKLVHLVTVCFNHCAISTRPPLKNT